MKVRLSRAQFRGRIGVRFEGVDDAPLVSTVDARLVDEWGPERVARLAFPIGDDEDVQVVYDASLWHCDPANCGATP